MDKQKIGFIVNPKAGIRKSAYDEVKSLAKDIFDDRYHVEIHLTRGAGDATAVAKHFVQENYDVVAVAGGDGTVNEAVQGLIGSETALAIIPYGSGNGLARGLSIPMNKEMAVRTITNGVARWIDMGELIDGDQRKLFVGFSGLGYDAFVGKLFNERKGRRGLFSYVYLSIVSFSKFEPVSLRVRVDEREIFAKPFVLAITNTQEYGNGAIIAPHAVPDDGLFELCILQNMTFIKGLFSGWRLFNGSIDKLEEMTMLRANKVEIIPDDRVHYHLDGESYITSNSLTFNILPGQLKVLVPL